MSSPLTIIFGRKPSKLKFLPCRNLVTNSFDLGSFKILGAMATKIVATWRVENGVVEEL